MPDTELANDELEPFLKWLRRTGYLLNEDEPLPIVASWFAKPSAPKAMILGVVTDHYVLNEEAAAFAKLWRSCGRQLRG
jgi:hypothetical protein